VAARDRGEPLAGTASVVRAWALVEQPGPWGPDALTQSRLDPDLGRALAARGRRVGVRVLLVRRPDWLHHLDGPPPRRCYVAHTGATGSWARALDGTAADLLDLDWSLLRRPTPPPIGAPVEAPLLLVCTHGRHDRCCADFGRPLVRALHADGIDEVWESSHVGGDRFAANLVALPGGLYFGRLQPEEGPGVVRALADGQLSLRHYRGRCCYPPDVQAAEVAVRAAVDWTALEGPALVELDRPDENRLATMWALPDGRTARVGVRRRRAPAVPLTCHADLPSQPWAYGVDEVEVRPPPALG
jgi:hypothetical protein